MSADPTASVEEGSEPTEAERQAEDNAQKIEERLSDLAEWIDSSATIKSFLDSQKEMEAIRLIGSSIMAGLLGSGALQIAFRELFGGTSPSDSAATKEALAAVTKLTAEQPVGGSNGAMSEAAQADWQAAIAKADQAIAESKANVAEIEGRISVLQEQNTINSHLQELATLHKGEGLIRVLQRQLEDMPERFGFTGDTTDSDAVHQWAQKTAAGLSIKEGYWDPKTGDQVWVKWTDKEPISFKVINTDGNLSIEEQGTTGRTFVHHRTDTEQMLYNEKHAQLDWNEGLDREYPTRSVGVVDERTGLRITPKVGRGIDEDTLRQAAADRGDIQGKGVMESRSASSARFGDRGFIEPTLAEPDTTESIRVPSGAAEVGGAEPGAIEEPQVPEVVSGSGDQLVGAVSPAGAEQAAAAVESSVTGPEDFPEAVRPYAHYLEVKLQAAQELVNKYGDDSETGQAVRDALDRVKDETLKFVESVDRGNLTQYENFNLNEHSNIAGELQTEITEKSNVRLPEVETGADQLLNTKIKVTDSYSLKFISQNGRIIPRIETPDSEFRRIFESHNNMKTDGWLREDVVARMNESVGGENFEATYERYQQNYRQIRLTQIDFLVRALDTLRSNNQGASEAAQNIRQVIKNMAEGISETVTNQGSPLNTDSVFTRDFLDRVEK